MVNSSLADLRAEAKKSKIMVHFYPVEIAFCSHGVQLEWSWRSQGETLKDPCVQFMQTKKCKYGLSCKFFHGNYKFIYLNHYVLFRHAGEGQLDVDLASGLLICLESLACFFLRFVIVGCHSDAMVELKRTIDAIIDCKTGHLLSNIHQFLVCYLLYCLSQFLNVFYISL